MEILLRWRKEIQKLQRSSLQNISMRSYLRLSQRQNIHSDTERVWKYRKTSCLRMQDRS